MKLLFQVTHPQDPTQTFLVGAPTFDKARAVANLVDSLEWKIVKAEMAFADGRFGPPIGFTKSSVVRLEHGQTTTVGEVMALWNL